MATSQQADHDAPIVNLQSKKHEQLLNVIDQLRSQGISRFIDLPQLIVTGDQSSGKSSVLEAVSGLKFPTKDALCTRFATELILRRSHQTSTAISIVPDPERPQAEKDALSAFKNDNSLKEDFGSIVDAAAVAMGVDGDSKRFAKDVLRIELSGPSQPHLTLVDLPGLFHAGSRTQSDEDAIAVKALVRSYMQRPRSIILAVVSAKNDFANQAISAMAREFDPEGLRTLGMITKPDTLDPGSDMEKQYLELAQGKEVNFRLGWHVLKNRGFPERDWTDDQRDEAERVFFSRGVWTSLQPSQLGIDSLKPRLSKVLQNQILRELPSLMHDVESGLKECQDRLDRLGTSRGTLPEQRLHLHTASEAFTNVIKDAYDGSYDADFFGDATTQEGYVKRLRAVTNNLLEDFAAEMRLKGHQFFVDDKASNLEDQKHAPPYGITYEKRIERVKDLIKRNRGKELSVMVKENTITSLFREQCKPWAGITDKYADDIFDAVKCVVVAALDTSCDSATRDGVLSAIINPALDNIKAHFDGAVAKCLKQHISSHCITFNHYLSENIQNLRKEHMSRQVAEVLQDFFGVDPHGTESFIEERSFDVHNLLNALVSISNEAEMTTFACSEAIYIMEAYYKVAIKYFTDDFAISAVEHSLLNQIGSLFTPATILKLDEEVVEDIAGETEESKLERASCANKQNNLKSALDILKRLDRGDRAKLGMPQ